MSTIYEDNIRYQKKVGELHFNNLDTMVAYYELNLKNKGKTSNIKEKTKDLFKEYFNECD